MVSTIESAGTNGNACNSGHTWTWAGDPNHPLPEKYPCNCGLMLWHKELCKECGNAIIKPIKNKEVL